MQREGVMSNVFIYSALIGACERIAKSDRAPKVFERMQREGVEGCSTLLYRWGPLLANLCVSPDWATLANTHVSCTAGFLS